MDKSRRTLVTVSVMLASIMQSLDATIANVALPHIQGSLSGTQDEMSWVLTSYIVAAAIMIPMSGWLAGRIGRRRVLLYSISGFTVASVLCGLAQSLPEIVVARLAQGLCGAALVPMSQAALLDIYPPSQHASAMAVWVMGVTLGPIFGPALGGWLTENYDWRWVFYINVPFGILAFFGTAVAMQETVIGKSKFDVFGFGTLSIGIAAFQLTLDRGQLNDWFSSKETLVEASLAAVAFYLFVVHMFTTTSTRFVSPTLFKDRNFLAGNVFIFVVGVVLFATLALLPALMQDLLSYPVLTTGVATAPRGVGTLLSMFLVGRLVRAVDVRWVIAAGFAISAYACWRMTGFNLQMDKWTIIWSGFWQGIGTGFVFVPLAAVAFATLKPELRNEGTAIFSLTRNLGSSIGISVVETLLTRNTQIMHEALAANVTAFNPILRQQLVGGVPTALSLVTLDSTITKQATMIAYNDDFQLMMYLCLGSIPFVLLLRRVKSRSTEPAAIE